MLGLLAGPIISLLVGFLKRIPIVAQHPKTVATILAGAATIISIIPGVGGPIADIVNQLGGSIGAITAVAAVSVATAIGTHEVAGNVTRAIGVDPSAPTTSTPSPVARSTASPLQGT